MKKYVKKLQHHNKNHVYYDKKGRTFYCKENETNDEFIAQRLSNVFELNPKFEKAPIIEKIESGDEVLTEKLDLMRQLNDCSSVEDIKKLAEENGVELKDTLTNFNKLKKDFRKKIK